MDVNSGTIRKLLMDDSAKRNIIRHATIEILDSCNYKCRHCYVKNTYKSLIEYEDFCKIIDQLKEEGCLWILLTGGEVLIHPNFKDMYVYAYKKGFAITIFTNGYLLNDELINLFEKYPPENIEITLYGCTTEFYDKYVGISGAFIKVENNINLLLNKNIKFTLKTVLTQSLFNEFEDIKAFCNNKNVSFRYDGFIFPKIDGDKAPCVEDRLDVETIIDLDLEDKPFINKIKEDLNEDKKVSNELYVCKAGNNSIFVDANLHLSICSLARHDFYDLNKNGATIKKGQNYLLDIKLNKKPLNITNECFNCKLRSLCRYCPGQFLLENNDEYKHNDWNCKYAHLLVSKIENL